MPPERLFDEATLRRLEQLTLITHRVRAGTIKGERRSSKKGTSIEFADYRDYTRGDDLRRLDWNVYARLERPFIKLLEEEEDLTVHLLIDSSESMNWPPPGPPGAAALHKFRYARLLAGALATIGLTGGDRVSVALLGGGAVADRRGPLRGRGHLLPLLDWLSDLQTGGLTDLDAALRDYALRGGRPGLALLISDMLSPGGYTGGLTALQGRGYEVGLIHLLAPDEVEPDLAGDLRLLDSETGAGQEVTVDGAMRGLYARRLREWRDEMAAACFARDVHYIAIETGTPWTDVVFHALRRAAVVR